jgi:hypothetical protein
MTRSKPRSIPFVQALTDKRLLGAMPEFANLRTWSKWIAFYKAFEGVPLDAEELAIFRACTGREKPDPKGYAVAVCQTGRQSGKTFTSAAMTAWTAVMQTKRGLYIPLLAQDSRGAMRASLGYVKAIFDQVPAFKGLVVGEQAESLTLKNGTTVAVYPGNRPSAVRGVRSPFAHMDECAFYITSEGRPTDLEAYRAIQSCLALQGSEPGGGRLLVTSSPYMNEGLLADRYAKHYGKASSVLFWQASAPYMNPSLPADYLDRLRQTDPASAEAEIEGRFRPGASTLFDYEALEACVNRGRREYLPSAGRRYVGFTDPSGGRSDAATACVAHADGESVVVDALRVWRAPFNPEDYVRECADFFRSYRVTTAISDKYAGAWVQEAFARHAIRLDQSSEDKSALYGSMLAIVNSQRCELPDISSALAELHRLERVGRRIDHRRGGHDDEANSIAGAIHYAGVKKKQRLAWAHG